MTNKEILEKFRNLSDKERRNIPYEELVKIMKVLDLDEKIEFENIIGYPVATRVFMNEINHLFVLLQDGAAAIIVNDKGQILMQCRTDNGRWGLPGGCQNLGEDFETTVIREVKEETNLDVKKEDVKLIGCISGMGRMRQYPNGDTVVNNTMLYLIDKFSGELKFDSESKMIKFFDIDNLPKNQHDEDLVEIYMKTLKKN